MSAVYFVSLGCPKNLVDSQVMLGKLQDQRYTITDNPSVADVIIVNTCSFIQASIEESIDTLLELADYKETGQCKVLVASGCLPQRYASTLQVQLPEVDLFVGTGQYHQITQILEDYAKPLVKLPKRVYVDQPAFIHSEQDARAHTTGATAYLKISEGCNRRCAFCIIPKLRGNVRSRSIESLVIEAQNLAHQGVKELNLVAQDLTEYGMETKYTQKLELLLPALAKVEGIEWIRLHYVYPDAFSDELIDVIANEPKIVKYLDMPIQHTVDHILQKMNRRLTKQKLFHLIDRLRSKIPEIVFRTSIIVGFPSETEQDFLELQKDLSDLNLDYVGVFRYSKEQGTKAFDMSHQVHPSTKRRREKQLKAFLHSQAMEIQKKHIGKVVPILLEGSETEFLLSGRMSTQAQEIDGKVLINDADTLSSVQVGQFAFAQITDVVGIDLLGKLICASA